jgi:CHAT domain-containing protein
MADDESRTPEPRLESSERQLGSRTSKCLSDAEAALLLGKADLKTERFLDHIAECDYCGPRVRLLMTNDSNETPDEEKLIAQMKSSSTAWQEQIAHRLEVAAQHENPSRSFYFSWQRWAVAAGIVALLSGAALYWQSRSGSPEKLLAQAYTAHREFDWRLPDAGWARTETQRGAIRERVPALLKAEAKLADDAGHENDPLWLDLRARAALLGLHFDEAITLLERAKDIDPRNPDLLADLAAAHGLRAQSMTDEAADFAAVVEFSTRALAIDPKHKRALYNRAIAQEELHVVDAALEDWDKYLQLETDPAWIKDARERADRLRVIQNKRAELLRTDEDSDAVLETKAVRWLKEDRAKARRVGQILLQKYGDRWLADAAEEQGDSAALLELNIAINAGQADDADRLGASAAQRYFSMHAPAHWARAELERLNGLNRKFRAEECLRLAASLAQTAEARGYFWIHIQALSQAGGCERIRGNAGASVQVLSTALAAAKAHGLLGLQVRLVGFEAKIQTDDGDVSTAWRENRKALADIAQSSYSTYRLQQCLVNYSDSADLRGLPAASYWFMRAAAHESQGTTNRLIEAAQRARAAYLASEAGFDSDYREEAQLADNLFSGQPQSDTRDAYVIEARLRDGQQAIRLGNAAEAVRILRPVAGAVVLEADQFDAYRLLGAGLLRSEGRTAAIAPLRAAAKILEGTVATHNTAAARSLARRGGVAAFRTLAGLMLDDSATQPEALRIWLAAHGSQKAPDFAFIALEHGYAVWVEKGAVLRRLDVDRAAVRRSATKLLHDAADPASTLSEIEREERFLYQQIWKPLEPFVHSNRVSVLPDGELAALPFALLMNADGHWLNESVSVVLSAHSSVEEPWRAPSESLVVGSPATKEVLSPLPDSLEEAGDVASRFPGRTLLKGKEATLDAVTRRLATADHFHFSGHGYAAAAVGGLYLTDSLLTSVTAREMSLPKCRLAVLSACLTALGQEEGLYNPDSLVHALLDAGARTVIASRWNVDSRATALLMSRFYDGLQTSGDPALSLHQASESLRADSLYKHPYYWAAFQTYE